MVPAPRKTPPFRGGESVKRITLGWVIDRPFTPIRAQQVTPSHLPHGTIIVPECHMSLHLYHSIPVLAVPTAILQPRGPFLLSGHDLLLYHTTPVLAVPTAILRYYLNHTSQIPSRQQL